VISFVVDTNVLVAAVLGRRANAPPALILQAVLEGRLRPVVSDALIAEYLSVLGRPKIAARHGLTPAETESLVVAIVRQAVVVAPTSPGPPAPDPGDQFLFDLLVELPGSVLVTGDARLFGREGATVIAPVDLVQRLDLGA
jgi:putative PIN family toxin of toxin-antitoxin system